MYGHKDGLLSYSIILAPKDHPSTKREVESLTNGLCEEYKNNIHRKRKVCFGGGAEVTNVKPGDRVTVNVETFSGECFFCKNGYYGNLT